MKIRIFSGIAAILFLGMVIAFISYRDKKEEEIHKLQSQESVLKQVIKEKDNEIEDLQERLDNARSHAEDVQSALEDGSFSDAYDCADDVIYETDY